MSESEMEGKDGIVNGDVEAERVRFENQRMTRRQALRKFGFTAGMMVFATLSIDDLARVAARKLQETEMTKSIGDTLAKEFRDAGVVLANPDGGIPNPYGFDCRDCTGYCNPDDDYDCVDCPAECATPYGWWPFGGKQKKLKCLNAPGNYEACVKDLRGYDNELHCCEEKCYACDGASREQREICAQACTTWHCRNGGC